MIIQMNFDLILNEIWYHMLLKYNTFNLISRLLIYHWYVICLLINWYQDFVFIFNWYQCLILLSIDL